MSLIKRKFSYTVGVLKNFDSKQTKIQQKKSLWFPDLQETTDTTVVVEFIKIQLSILGGSVEESEAEDDCCYVVDFVVG